MKTKIENMYLDWFNNFLTIEAFADYYELSTPKALRILSIGYHLNQSRHDLQRMV
jgi:hypothetical protein